MHVLKKVWDHNSFEYTSLLSVGIFVVSDKSDFLKLKIRSKLDPLWRFDVELHRHRIVGADLRSEFNQTGFRPPFTQMKFISYRHVSWTRSAGLDHKVFVILTTVFLSEWEDQFNKWQTIEYHYYYLFQSIQFQFNSVQFIFTQTRQRDGT